MAPDPLADLPPSAKLVFKVLEYDGPLTQKELVDRSMLAQRTVRDALRRLREHDIVEKRVYLPDARQNIYELRVEPDPPTDAEAEAETPATGQTSG